MGMEKSLKHSDKLSIQLLATDRLYQSCWFLKLFLKIFNWNAFDRQRHSNCIFQLIVCLVVFFSFIISFCLVMGTDSQYWLVLLVLHKVSVSLSKSCIDGWRYDFTCSSFNYTAVTESEKVSFFLLTWTQNKVIYF